MTALGEENATIGDPEALCFKRMIKPLALAAVLFYSSCSDLLENDNAFFHVSTQEQQWNSLTDTRSALFGTYGLMRPSYRQFRCQRRNQSFH